MKNFRGRSKTSCRGSGPMEARIANVPTCSNKAVETDALGRRSLLRYVAPSQRQSD